MTQRPRARPQQVRHAGLAIGYVRAGTTFGATPDEQADRIIAYCAYRRLKLACLVDGFEDDAVLPLRERSGGADLLRQLEKKGHAHVVVASLDRLFLDTAECLRTADTWRANGIALHIVDLAGSTVDTSSAMGRFFITMLAAFGEYAAACARDRNPAGAPP
jgi:DNA invertase Pin-like site-specific DNA recombinase